MKDGKIYGRGAEDNNQAIVSSLFTVKAFKECGVTPNIGIGLLLVSDEEMGTQTYGAKYVLDNKKSIFKKDDLIIVPDSGNLTGTDIVVAEKSITWLKITTIGKQAHAVAHAVAEQHHQEGQRRRRRALDEHGRDRRLQPRPRQ